MMGLKQELNDHYGRREYDESGMEEDSLIL
jgi:hypothetical protein